MLFGSKLSANDMSATVGLAVAILSILSRKLISFDLVREPLRSAFCTLIATLAFDEYDWFVIVLPARDTGDELFARQRYAHFVISVTDVWVPG